MLAKELCGAEEVEDAAYVAITMEEANHLMMKKPLVDSTLNDYIVSTSTQPPKTRIIPVKLNIDLNSPTLKTKGIKPKKIKKIL